MDSNSSTSTFEIADHHLATQTLIYPTLSTLTVAITAGTIDGWALLQTADRALDWPTFLMVHAGITLAIAVWSVHITRGHNCGRDAILMLLAQATAGAIGCGGIILMQVMLLILRRRAKGFMEWYLSLFPDDQKSMGRSLYDSLMTGRERESEGDSVTSFSDILEVGTPAQKQTTLALLARNFRPKFAPALKRAMNDTDGTVRVMAATAASRVESLFLDKALAQEAQLQDRKNNYDSWLATARLYDDYAFTGILDFDRERENRDKARDAYLRCTELAPTEATPVIALGRIALRSGDHATAITHFRQAHALAPDRIDITVWLIEAIYRSGDFAEVRSLALSLGEDLDALKNLTEEVKRSVRLWRGEEAA